MNSELPVFQTESEEADWWYDNREEVEAEFIVAAAEGRLTQRNGDDHHAIAPVELNLEDLEGAESILRNSRQPTLNGRIKKGDLRRSS